MIFIGLTVMFGGIILADNIKQNSKNIQIKNREAQVQAEKNVAEIMKKCESYAKNYVDTWEKTGLPPYKWK